MADDGSKPAPVRADVDGALWLIDPSWAAVIHSPGAPDWFAPAFGQGTVLVKRGHGRLVYRTTVGGRCVYVKLRTCTGAWARLLGAMGASPARGEFKVARAAWEAGVPTPRPLACGEASRPSGQGAYLCEGVEDAATLTQFLHAHKASSAGPARFSLERRLLRALAEALARAHAKGFVHRDLHPDNVLVHHDPAHAAGVCFVDWHGARRTQPPLVRDRALNLVQLNQCLQRHCALRVRLRFLCAYLRLWRQTRKNPDETPSAHDLARMVTRLSVAHADRLARGRDRRLRGDGRYFAKLVLDHGWRATVMLRDGRARALRHGVTELPGVEAWRDLLSSFTSGARGPGGDAGGAALHTDARGTSALETCDVAGMPCTLRWQFPQGWLTRLTWRLTPSPAMKSFRLNHAHRHRDVDVPPILACMELRKAWGVTLTLLITGRTAPAADTGSGPTDATDEEVES